MVIGSLLGEPAKPDYLQVRIRFHSVIMDRREELTTTVSITRHDPARFKVCISIFLGILLLIGFAVPISALVISATSAHAECVGQYGRINVSYGTWLLVYGISCIILLSFMLFTLCLLVRNRAEASNRSICHGICLILFQGVFQLAWFVVGAVLYFNVVAPDCSSSSTVYAFGLALFVLQCIIIVTAIIAIKKCCSCNIEVTKTVTTTSLTLLDPSGKSVGTPRPSGESLTPLDPLGKSLAPLDPLGKSLAPLDPLGKSLAPLEPSEGSRV